ncbi:hypothetical protein HPB47_028414 [Ixodes persulcatus]|uniref:Uncharacterized protein n=1 Tax=Ixodes persulcatus TaxID=34615 RepID=A0AC60PUL0_IXOPE|nr:hypothetical protein HPB47_028414 [Ixodes persulcatus]
MAPTPATRLLAVLSEKYAYLVSLRDPRITGWSLTADLRFILPVCLGYLYVVMIAGPRWMGNRKPYNLKTVIMAYNLFQVIANAVFFLQYMRLTYLGGNYSLFCQGIDYSPNANEMRILRTSWWYLFVRITDLMDTIFFVATKKFSHITYLHVVHHSLVVLNGWLYLNFGGGGQLIMVLCFNTLVHVVMYGYYFLSSLGPRIQKYLWWKRYLTRLQIFQIAFLTGQRVDPRGNERKGGGNVPAWCANLGLSAKNKRQCEKRLGGERTHRVVERGDETTVDGPHANYRTEFHRVCACNLKKWVRGQGAPPIVSQPTTGTSPPWMDRAGRRR